mgnify:CR=1 FL=1
MYNNNPKGPQIIFRLIEIAFLGIVGASKLVKPFRIYKQNDKNKNQTKYLER